MYKRFTVFIGVIGILLFAACSSPTSKVAFTDIKSEGDAAHGQALFEKGEGDAPACATCHNTSDVSKVGPGLLGIADRAATRVSGQSAREYIFYSITAPGRYIVPGFTNVMYPNYADKLSAQDISDVMTYLMQLK